MAELDAWPARDTQTICVESIAARSTRTRLLFRAPCLVTGNSHEAEELMQDAFLNLWERWDMLGQIADPVAYL